jgi:hypothetical protein
MSNMLLFRLPTRRQVILTYLPVTATNSKTTLRLSCASTEVERADRLDTTDETTAVAGGGVSPVSSGIAGQLGTEVLLPEHSETGYFLFW